MSTSRGLQVGTPLRVAAFVVALAVVFAIAWGGGRLVGPIDTEPAPAHDRSDMTHDDD